MNNKKVSRQSFVEDIEVKPSTELTPDEYEHFQKSVENIEVHTFAGDWECAERDIEVFSKTLLKCGIEIKPENKHNLETDNYNEILDKICEQSDTRSGLVILFSGYSRKDGCLRMFDGNEERMVAIQEIWKKFNSYNCISLKNKPKIFIFEVSAFSLKDQVDSRIRPTYELTYDTPAEADMLIVYHKTDDSEDEFVQLLCEMIEQYGETEDIISLVTCVTLKNPRPILISTLTRRFYFTASDVRGLHSVIHKNQRDLVAHVKDVKEIICVKYPEKKEKRRFFSFTLGKKSKDKREQSPSETKEDVPQPKPSARKTVSGSPSRQVPTTALRRPSTSIRPRTLSQTESESGRSSKKVSERDKFKPWKPC